MELLYADDLVLLAESEEELNVKIASWKRGMEEKELRVNIEKTKVMRCQGSIGLVEDSGKWSCGGL
jgi:Reverse transcriptase (RNA-dependent DNA polymerase)